MSNFSGYSSKATAVRGLGRFLGTASRNNPDLDVASLIEQVDGKWGFYEDKANAAVGLGGLSEEDENLKLSCGHTHCPSCGVHLSNGLMDFDNLADQHGEKAAYGMQKHEWSCMGCGHEWGAPIEAPKSKARGTTGRRYENRAKSDVAKPSDIVWAIADGDRALTRKQVVEAAVAKGVTPNTANAAYQHWRKARGLVKAKV